MHKNRFLTIISSVVIFLTLVLVPAYVSAEEVTDPDYGYNLNLPEGFFIDAQSEDGMSVMFSSKEFPVHVILRLYGKKEFETSTLSLKGALDKLSAQGDIIDFTWKNTNCSFSIFDMKLPGEKNSSSGWALSSELPGKDTNLVLIAYCDQVYINQARPFFFSILNSLCIDEGSWTTCGPLVSCTFPQQKKQTVQTTICGKKVTSSIYEEDFEASQFVIETEWNVLKLYANQPKWKEAWQRFYQVLYRDSAGRLKKFTNDIYRTIYPLAKKKNPENIPYEVNAILLDWIQYFTYGRNQGQSQTDITPPVSVITGAVSDCDARSLLMCVMLKQIGIDSTLFISNEYKHAVYGARVKPVSQSEGAAIAVNEKNYLLGETTAKGVKPGLMAQEYSDSAKWIPVQFR